jgi:hypothetical protein
MEGELVARRDSVFYLKRIAGALMLLALSATFFYSAYTKSGVEFQGFHLVQNDNSFDSFQWTFLDMGISSLLVAGIVARIFIGLELVLGLFLLFHVFLRQFTYKAVIAILTIFIIYLLVVIARQGNSGNCGCFGDKLAMKPLTAIWKNLIMIGMTVVLWFIYPVRPFRYQEFVGLFLALAAFSTPFLVNNVYTGTLPEPYSKQVDLGLLYKYNPAPPEDLRKGKHIIAFMSLTCPHCKKAAYLLHLIHDQHPDIPIYLVLDGPETYKKAFFDETHAANLPYLYYRHTEDFIKMAGSGVPSILWFNNGVVEYKSVYAYYQLDPSFMEQWLKVAPPAAIPAGSK